MANDVQGFSRRNAERIAKTVRYVEAYGQDIAGNARRGGQVSGIPEFWAKVISSTAVAGTPTTKWTYTCQRIIKIAAGYGVSAWSTIDSDEMSSFTAYNLAEAINSTTGRQGNGVDVANLDPASTGSDTFDFYPIQNGQPVIIKVAFLQDGTPEYWIAGIGLPNGVDGGCT